MAQYEANRDYYKRRKLAGHSPGNNDEVSTISVLHINWILYLRVAKVWNEAIPLKKGFILQSKGAYFQKIGRHAMRGVIIFHFFSSTSRGTAWLLHFKFGSYAYDIAYKYSQFRAGNKATVEQLQNILTRKCMTLWGWAWARWYRILCHCNTIILVSHMHIHLPFTGVFESVFACWFTNLSWYIAGFVFKTPK